MSNRDPIASILFSLLIAVIIICVLIYFTIRGIAGVF